jgi:hypothetical protein
MVLSFCRASGSSRESGHVHPFPENDGFILNYVAASFVFKFVVMGVFSWAFSIICGKINAMFLSLALSPPPA